MECIILAGGLGTRLRSSVSELPKCMAPVNDNPFLFYILKYLEHYKCNHIILSLGYKHKVVSDWIEQIEYSWPFKFSYMIEDQQMGTGGAIKLALKKATEEQVLIINGDTYFDINITELYNEHIDNKAEISIALKPMYLFDRYGSIVLDRNNRITSFIEKQFCREGNINGGIYLINGNSTLLSDKEGKFSFETEILQKKYREAYMHGYISDEYFIDIGIPEDYEKAIVDFKSIFRT